MADQANLFEPNGNKDNNTIVPPIVTNPDPLADKLNKILGADGKPKYANPLVALDALEASQAHITRLEAEKAQERAELERLREVERNARSLEEIADRLKPNPKETTTQSGLDENTVSELVKRTLEDRDRQATAKANLLRVNDTLTEKFKDKAPEMVAAKAKELGMAPEELGRLASQSPALVLQLFGQTASIVSSPTQTSVHLNPNIPTNEIEKPKHSLISGVHATDKNREELMRKIKEKVYRENGVTT